MTKRDPLAVLHGPLFAQVTSELESYSNVFDKTRSKIDRLESLASGLRHKVCKNQSLWKELESYLRTADPIVEPEMRAMWLMKANWVEQHTQGVLAGGKDLSSLIELNRSCMSSLGL
ncbi:MAG: flagellar biosynthesis regulator FlaF [Pseudomonadota bacterium]